MSFSPISSLEGQALSTDPKSWYENYKESELESFHDTSELTLVHPDDCLFVAGPPRLTSDLNTVGSGDSSNFFVLGMATNVQFAERRQVQPVKAIGSRRHIFAVTNTPVTGSIGRLMILGRNLYNALYANAVFGSDITARNSKYADKSDSLWWTNAEEDIFRVPFGLGIIYNSAATAAGSTKKMHADYFEVCTLTNRSVNIQSGQSMVMEQVGFMADRVVPWSGWTFVTKDDLPKTVQNVSSMAGTAN